MPEIEATMIKYRLIKNVFHYDQQILCNDFYFMTFFTAF